MHLVLVDDNPADANLFKRALQAGKTAVDLVWLTDGIEALEHLSESSHICDLLLLDLSLPRLNGFELLERLRAQDEFKSLPILILSGSCDPADVERCYRAGANSYICKPVHVNDFFAMAETVVSYWLTCTTRTRRKNPEIIGRAGVPKRLGA